MIPMCTHSLLANLLCFAHLEVQLDKQLQSRDVVQQQLKELMQAASGCCQPSDVLLWEEEDITAAQIAELQPARKLCQLSELSFASWQNLFQHPFSNIIVCCTHHSSLLHAR